MKPTLLQLLLVLGACYYLVGAVAHFFGITLFPWYDGNLYTPYHDSVIALAAFVFFVLLLSIARNPAGNRDALNAVIAGAFLASLFSVAIVWKVDFAALGASGKEIQTIVEGVLGFIFTGLLIYLYPRNDSPRQES